MESAQIGLFKSLRANYIPSIQIFLKAVSTSKFLPRFSRFINKNLYMLGLGSSINRYNNSIGFYFSKQDKRLYESYNDTDIFCNFGSGAFFHKRWVNFDFPGVSSYYQALQGKKGVDFQAIDLCIENLRLPFLDNSVSLIYCSHTLEHIEETRAKDFIKECHRILKKNGIMRLVIPSTDNDHKIMSIINDQPSISEQSKHHLSTQVGSHILTDTSELDEKKVRSLLIEAKFNPVRFYELAINAGVSNKFLDNNPERHITFWNYSKLSKLAQALSFNACIPFYRGSSLAKPFSNLCVFDSTEPQISLYVELIK